MRYALTQVDVERIITFLALYRETQRRRRLWHMRVYRNN